MAQSSRALDTARPPRHYAQSGFQPCKPTVVFRLNTPSAGTGLGLAQTPRRGYAEPGDAPAVL